MPETVLSVPFRDGVITFTLFGTTDDARHATELAIAQHRAGQMERQLIKPDRPRRPANHADDFLASPGA